MADGETKEEFRARMLSIGVMLHTSQLPKERTIVRNDGMVDNGKRAKVYTQEGDCGSTAEYTESDNRLDCNITPETHYQETGFMQGL